MKPIIHSAQQGWELSPWLREKCLLSLGTSLPKPSQEVT